MDIYPQEVEAATFLTVPAEDVRNKVMSVASTFPAVLRQATRRHGARIPTPTWYLLYKSEHRDR